MDKPNQRYSESQPPEPDDQDDLLAYMYQQEEHAGMQQLFQGPRRHPTPPDMMTGLPNLSFGSPAPAIKNEPGQPSSSTILSFGALPAASTLNFSSGGEGWPDVVAVEGVPLERRSRSQSSTPEHVVAERKRREKMQQQFVALATMVPDLTETDKISILGSTIQYVKQLEEKVKTLEKQNARRKSSEPSTVFDDKGHISSTDKQHNSCPSGSANSVGCSNPSVEATIHDNTILLKICCERRSGVLVMIISELESMGLSIINTSVLPFTNTYFSISITAKIGEGFSMTVELVNNLTRALRDFS